MSNPATGPRFRLAPGVVLRGGHRPPLPTPGPAPAADPTANTRPAPAPGDEQQQRPPAPGFRNTRWDRAALAVSIDPVWLLAPLFARDAAGLAPHPDGPGPVAPAIDRIGVDGADLAGASADWPRWWTAALAYRPGTPAPRVEDLIADSPSLQYLWDHLADGFRGWLASRPSREPGPDAASRSVERQVLAAFGRDNDRAPGRWTVRILEIPVTGEYLFSPEPRRLVVSAALRADPDRYRDALTAHLPHHF